MRSPRRPAISRRPVHAAAIALALLAAACSREVEVTVVVDSASLFEKASMDATAPGDAEMGKRLVVKVPKYGTKPFWAVKGAKTFVKADEVAPFPIAGTPMFVTAEKLTVLGRAGAVVKELRLGTPVSTFSNAVLADRKILAVIESGVVAGFCDPAGVSAEKPPAAVFAARIRELARAADFPGAKQFVDAGLAAYPGEPSIKPWADLLQRATEPFAFATPGQRAAIVPEPALKKGAVAYVAPLAAAVLAAPRSDTKPVSVLRQNTPVQVLEIGGAFAKIELAEGEAVAWASFEGYLSLLPERVPDRYRAPETEDGEAAVTAAATETAFYVRVVDLQAAPSTEESLVARAQKAQAAGKQDEAIELFSRAAGLGDTEEATATSLFDAAVAAGDLERAVWAVLMAKSRFAPVHALRGATGWSEPRLDEVALVHGCLGPMQPGGAIETVAMRGVLRRPKPGQCLAVTGSPVVCVVCAEDIDSASEHARKETQANEQFIAKADDLYPPGPYLRITVANASLSAGPPRQPLFVVYGGKTYWVPILALGAYERVTVYVRVDTDRDVYGVSLGEEDPGEPSEEDGGAFVVQAPEAATVWVGQADPECGSCERGEGDDGEEGDGYEGGDAPAPSHDSESEGD